MHPTELNLGCGTFPIKGALNIDIRPEVNPDMVMSFDNFDDMRQRLPMNHFKIIHCHHVIEHLQDPFGFMRVCWDLLEPGGILDLKMPHVSRGMAHAEHKHGFDYSFQYFFNPKLPDIYYGPEFECVSFYIRWEGLIHLYAMVVSKTQLVVLKVLDAVFTWLANLSPGFCCRFWCYWVGGFDQMEFVFKKPRAHT